MFVFDTSAFINGWRHHYFPATFPGVWTTVAAGLNDGRIMAPREVLNELQRRDDDIYEWARSLSAAFVDPSDEVQNAVGPIYALFSRPGDRDAADPWVVAEALTRGFAVVTYEGRTFAGPVSAKATKQKIPGVCAQLDVLCITMAEALSELGDVFA